MATLYVTEFKQLGPTGASSWGAQGNAPFVSQPPLAEQTVAIGATSAASGAFDAATSFVRIHTDAICSVEINADPTATATKARMAAGQTEYFSIPAGNGFKVAVITNT